MNIQCGTISVHESSHFLQSAKAVVIRRFNYVMIEVIAGTMTATVFVSYVRGAGPSYMRSDTTIALRM